MVSSDGKILVALSVNRDGVFVARCVGSSSSPPALQCNGIDLEKCCVTGIAGTPDSGCALLRTASNTIVIVGFFDGEVNEFQTIDAFGSNSEPSLPLVLRSASNIRGSVFASGGGVIGSVANGTRHCLVLSLDETTGVTRVAARGFGDMHVMGPPQPIKTMLHPAEGLGMAHDSRSHAAQLHNGPWPDFFQEFNWIPGIESLGVTQVFAGRHLSFFVGRDGVYACGKFSERLAFKVPTRIFREKLHIDSVAVLNTKVYFLCRGNRMMCLDSEPSLGTTGEEPQLVDESWVFNGVPRHATLMSLSGGAAHCAVIDKVTGNAYGWGLNTFGQLSVNGPSYIKNAIQLHPGVTFAAVFALRMKTIFLDDESNLVASLGGC
jgi:hypothetical protein